MNEWMDEMDGWMGKDVGDDDVDMLMSSSE